ncbi:uncharacterized protein [Mycetomoellerius zeteki]|uniref:uncharacterized protein n=1 Tax=Mycetomoellerius zeteki TaxID=64791 RepID=UPI00084E3E33|nr:PREDICTED: uncharacterized protein LOC108728772 [Trachymyrmex zeteki]
MCDRRKQATVIIGNVLIYTYIVTASPIDVPQFQPGKNYCKHDDQNNHRWTINKNNRLKINKLATTKPSSSTITKLKPTKITSTTTKTTRSEYTSTMTTTKGTKPLS